MKCPITDRRRHTEKERYKLCGGCGQPYLLTPSSGNKCDECYAKEISELEILEHMEDLEWDDD